MLTIKYGETVLATVPSLPKTSVDNLRHIRSELNLHQHELVDIFATDILRQGVTLSVYDDAGRHIAEIVGENRRINDYLRHTK